MGTEIISLTFNSLFGCDTFTRICQRQAQTYKKSRSILAASFFNHAWFLYLIFINALL